MEQGSQLLHQRCAADDSVRDRGGFADILSRLQVGANRENGVRGAMEP
ncbi:hypothetical protein ALP80_200069 [Pseudomonas savastanoi pv. fraxini]|nr:hypothetical protein ALP80_200069 [Pseudomonas savastanoi pv. fraxini]